MGNTIRFLLCLLLVVGQSFAETLPVTSNSGIRLPVSTVTTLTSNHNPSTLNTQVTFTATVLSIGNVINEGTVTFMDGLTVLSGNVAVSAGSATFMTSALTVGSHSMRAIYSGTTNFNTSSATLSQTVSCPPATLVPTSATLTCASPSVTLTAGGGTSYSFSAGASQIGASNQAVVSAEGTYTVTVTNASGCTTTASATVVSATESVVTWTGATSTDWHTASNWCPARVPTASDDVQIPYTTRKPIIMAMAVAKSVNLTGILTIATSGVLSVSGSTGDGLANLSGDLTNNGLLRVDNVAGFGINNERVGESNATMTNSGTITIGLSASIGKSGIQNIGSFSNATTGLTQIQVYNSNWNGVDNYTTYTNSGTLTVGSSASVDVAGVHNESTFTNTASGVIRVDQAPFGLVNYLGGNFKNGGTISLFLSATAGQLGSGIQNYNRFTNQPDAEIYLDGYRGNGIWNTANATTNFQNSGLIRIGSNAVTGVTGILNYRIFDNNDGEIDIDQPTGSAIVNNSTTGIFTNYALIRLGYFVAIPKNGIENSGSGAFINDANGEIYIDRTTNDGLSNLTSATFVNAGLVKIGESAAIGDDGIESSSTFSNLACAVLTVADNVNNSGTFTNDGLFTVNTAQPHTNVGTLTNTGIIEYPQGNFIPNVTNDDIIVGPISSCGSTTISPALQLGSSSTMTVGSTWYSDQTLTTPAGTYDQATNTFTATSLPMGSSTLLYFSADDNTTGCTRTVSISVTINAVVPVTITADPSLTITQGNSTTLTASGASSYSWSSGETTAAISVSVAGPYSMTGITSGCSSVTSVDVTVTAAALTLSDFSANPDPLCVGKVVTFQATVGNLSGSYAYTLTNGTSTTTGTGTNTTFSQSVTTTVSGIQTFSLIVSSNGQSATETYDLTVHAPPMPMLTASNGDGVSTSTLTCDQTTITLNASDGDDYLFSGPGILNQDPENGRAVVNAAGVYSVTVTNTETGCFSTTTTTVSSNTTAPSVSISPSSATLTCASPSVSLSVIGSGTIAWSTGESTATISVSTAATYTVMLTNAGGCSATASVTVSSNQTPPPVSINPSSTTLSNASPSVSLTAVGTGTYRWSTGATTQVISATASGTYSVTLTSPGGCTASASVPVVGSDLTINLDLPQANFAASGTASVGNFVVNVFEVGGLPTSSGNVTITVTVPIGYTLSFAGSLSSINVSGGEHNPVAVDNPQWTVSQSVGTRQLTLTMNSGVFISGGGESSLGFTISRITANSGSVANITVNVKDDLTMGYDSNLNNNVYARIINGL